MARSINEVRVVGLGKVGELVATLLADSGFTVTAYDARERSDLPFVTKSLDVRDSAVATACAGRCRRCRVLPAVQPEPGCRRGRLRELGALLRPDRGRAHHQPGAGTRLRRTRRPSSLPQCGLAPGLIGIIGSSLTKHFDEIRSIELKVGALPRHPAGLLGYAFNWSAEGVVNEYLNDCEVLRSGHRQMVPAMTEHERVVIGGIELEASLTSGGLGTMCETYEGRVQRLDYKTMRYPGHFELMRFFFDELGLRDRRELAGEILVDAKPPVDDDVVYLHAAVEGRADTANGGHALPQAVRPGLPAARDQRPSLAGDLLDHGRLGGRGGRAGGRRPACPRADSSSRRTSRSPTCCPPRTARCSATWERSEHDCTVVE